MTLSRARLFTDLIFTVSLAKYFLKDFLAMNARFYFAASAMFLSLMVGCNEPAFEKGVTVKGKIVKGGQVLKPSGPQALGPPKWK